MSSPFNPPVPEIREAVSPDPYSFFRNLKLFAYTAIAAIAATFALRVVYYACADFINAHVPTMFVDWLYPDGVFDCLIYFLLFVFLGWLISSLLSGPRKLPWALALSVVGMLGALPSTLLLLQLELPTAEWVWEAGPYVIAVPGVLLGHYYHSRVFSARDIVSNTARVVLVPFIGYALLELHQELMDWAMDARVFFEHSHANFLAVLFASAILSSVGTAAIAAYPMARLYRRHVLAASILATLPVVINRVHDFYQSNLPWDKGIYAVDLLTIAFLLPWFAWLIERRRSRAGDSSRGDASLWEGPSMEISSHAA